MGIENGLHHLGDIDLAVLDAVGHAGARLAFTATSEAPTSPALAELLAAAQRLSLPPLDDPRVEQLASELVGGARLDALDVRSLVEVTAARPGLIVRLLRGADIEVDGDLAILPPDLGAMPGAIAWRSARVDDRGLHLVCRLAARTPPLSRDEVAAAAHGDRADHERRRRWRAEAGEVLACDDRAALMEALLDEDLPHEALRLGSGSIDTPRLLLATARARAGVGDVDAAVVALERLLADRATGDAQRGSASLLLGDLLWFRRGDVVGALRVLEAAADTAPDAVALANLLRSALGRPLASTRAGAIPSTSSRADRRAEDAERSAPSRPAVDPPRSRRTDRRELRQVGVPAVAAVRDERLPQGVVVLGRVSASSASSRAENGASRLSWVLVPHRTQTAAPSPPSRVAVQVVLRLGTWMSPDHPWFPEVSRGAYPGADRGPPPGRRPDAPPVRPAAQPR